jgi:DNA-directed RNA polymerase subunit RPC12/RpoP
MTDFMKCQKCRGEYLAIGSQGHARCPACGAVNTADRLKPAPVAGSHWTCTKCKSAYETESVSTYSKCPRCGHRNKGA